MPGDLAARRVELEASPADDGAIDSAGSPLQGAYTSQQLAEIEGLDHVVVGARVQSLNPIDRRIAGGQHQDGSRAAVLPGPGCHLDARCPRHPPIQDGDVVFVELELLDGVIAAVDSVNVVTGVLEALDQNLAQTAVVFRHQDSHNSVWPYGARWPFLLSH